MHVGGSSPRRSVGPHHYPILLASHSAKQQRTLPIRGLAEAHAGNETSYIVSSLPFGALLNRCKMARAPKCRAWLGEPHSNRSTRTRPLTQVGVWETAVEVPQAPTCFQLPVIGRCSVGGGWPAPATAPPRPPGPLGAHFIGGSEGSSVIAAAQLPKHWAGLRRRGTKWCRY